MYCDFGAYVLGRPKHCKYAITLLEEFAETYWVRGNNMILFLNILRILCMVSYVILYEFVRMRAAGAFEEFAES